MGKNRLDLPLRGVCILNTRAAHQAPKLSQFLAERGAAVVEFPALEIVDPPKESLTELHEVLSGQTPPEWLLFTSANGVAKVAEFGRELGIALDPYKVAVIGEQTASAAEEAGLEVHFRSQESHSEGFATEFVLFLRNAGQLEQKGPKIALMRAKNASSRLDEVLTEAGLEIVSVAVYDTCLPQYGTDQRSQVWNALSVLSLEESDMLDEPEDEEGQLPELDMLVFTSSQTARNMLEMLKADEKMLVKNWAEQVAEIPVAVIGPHTAETVKELGWNLAVVAKKRSMELLVQGIIDFFEE